MREGRGRKIAVGLLLFFMWTPILLVVRHSVDEIHYFKTFYPSTFTPADAFFASGVELIKVLLIALPLLIGMVLIWKVSRDWNA